MRSRPMFLWSVCPLLLASLPLAQFGGCPPITPPNDEEKEPVRKTVKSMQEAAEGGEVITIGEAPDDFGHTFIWNRVHRQVLLCAFINAADNQGLVLANLKKGDTIEVSSASGLAAFSDQDPDKLLRSCVGLVAAATTVVADLGGLSQQSLDAISRAEAIAEDLFGDPIDNYVWVDASGQFSNGDGTCRQAGGLVIFLPQAHGPLYSGSSDHQEKWFKSTAMPRTEANFPSHIVGKCFCFTQDPPDISSAVLTQDGEVYIIAWDFKYTDNKGYYRTFVRLTQGNQAASAPE